MHPYLVVLRTYLLDIPTSMQDAIVQDSVNTPLSRMRSISSICLLRCLMGKWVPNLACLNCLPCHIDCLMSYIRVVYCIDDYILSLSRILRLLSYRCDYVQNSWGCLEKEGKIPKPGECLKFHFNRFAKLIKTYVVRLACHLRAVYVVTWKEDVSLGYPRDIVVQHTGCALSIASMKFKVSK